MNLPALCAILADVALSPTGKLAVTASPAVLTPEVRVALVRFKPALVQLVTDAWGRDVPSWPHDLQRALRERINQLVGNDSDRVDAEFIAWLETWAPDAPTVAAPLPPRAAPVLALLSLPRLSRAQRTLARRLYPVARAAGADRACAIALTMAQVRGRVVPGAPCLRWCPQHDVTPADGCAWCDAAREAPFETNLPAPCPDGWEQVSA